MSEQEQRVEIGARRAERAEWKRPEVRRMEAGEAEATRAGVRADAIYS